MSETSEHSPPARKKSWFGRIKGPRRSSSSRGSSMDDHSGRLYSDDYGGDYNFSDKASIPSYLESISEAAMLEEDNGDAEAIAATAQPVKMVKAKVLGKVIVTIHEVRFLAIQNSKMIIDLDGMGQALPLVETAFPYTQELDLIDIVADLKIKFRGTHMVSNTPTSGYVVVPLSQCLTAFGKAKGIPQKWYMVSPFYDRKKLGEPRQITKFRSAYPDIPGSGLAKPAFPLGFISLDVKLQLAPDIRSGLSLYFYPNPRILTTSKDTYVNQFDEAADINESTLVLANSRMTRDLERIKHVLFRPFSALSPFLSFPEVFPLIIVFSFFCHSLQMLFIPIAIFGLVFLNGFVAATKRAYHEIIIWNDPGVALALNSSGAISAPGPLSEDFSPSDVTRRSTLTSAPSMMRDSMMGPFGNAVQAVANVTRTSETIQKKMAELAHNLEAFCNLFTFADSRVSIIVYGYLLAIAVIGTAIIHFFSVATFFAVLGGIYFLAVAGDEFYEEQMAGLTEKSVHWKYIRVVQKYYWLFMTLMSKVPDQLELNHRYICSTMIVKEGGAEMLDSEPFFKVVG